MSDSYRFGKRPREKDRACGAARAGADLLPCLILTASENGRVRRIELAEPRSRALISCQIQTGLGQTWTNRLYEVIRAEDGQWRVDLGEGPLEPRRDWAALLDWLWSLRPRDVEMVEDT